VTKWKLVPPSISIGSRAWWVSTKSKANQKLGRSIRSIREQKRYSQERSARHAGFERSNYGAIERGEFNVRLDTIVKLAAGRDMTVAALCQKAKI
jgi:DNA-binding XRE family transcriptional regulator